MSDKTTTTTASKDVKVVKEDTIDIPKDQLKNLLESNKALIERLDRVESASSKALLARYDSKHEKRRQKKVSLIMYDGMVVKNWSNMLKNRVEKNVQTKNWEEEQVIKISFFDIDKSIQLHYEQFNRNYTKIDGTVIKEQINTDEDEVKYGDRTFIVKLEDGREYEIGKKFVN